MKEIELQPIREKPSDFERLEEMIRKLFLDEIYLPLLAVLHRDRSVLKNSIDDLLQAISSGRITYTRGAFVGKFDAAVSRELKKLGAKWSIREKAFKITRADLSVELKNAIDLSAANFSQKLSSIDRRLAEMLPEKIATKLKAEKFFDTTLWKTDQSFKKTVKGITVAPDLTKEHRARIAAEYTENMQKYIKEFSEKEIVKLRKNVKEVVLSGNRYESMISKIQKSYDVSYNKAKFLARQETGLLMAKFKETRYADAGVHEYKWRCVVGSPNHPVRPRHKELNDMSLKGKTFRFDDPPITDLESGARNNPGEDFNCRCQAVPVVKF